MSNASNLLVLLLQLATIVFIVRAILSWFPIGYDSPVRPVIDFINRITDPVLRPIRTALPPMGGLDISVLLVILVLQFLLVPVARGLG